MHTFSLIQHAFEVILNAFLQVIFKLNYIPHEALRALLGVLKKSWTGTLAGGVTGIDFGVVALKCFHR